jgi:aminoglycoside/choline kinase family phosphotransferase
VPAGGSAAEFLRWFDLMGLQRHIKVLGIFARLWYRDGKPGYLADLPLTLKYVRVAAAAVPELAEFSAWLEAAVVPRLTEANARELKAAALTPA